jgi:hypothetical protein
MDMMFGEKGPMCGSAQMGLGWLILSNATHSMW